MSQGEMDAYRKLIWENIGYDGFVRDRPYDAAQLDEMVELMAEGQQYNQRDDAILASRKIRGIMNGEHTPEEPHYARKSKFTTAYRCL